MESGVRASPAMGEARIGPFRKMRDQVPKILDMALEIL
jgi:hypothetical protein